MLSNHLTFTTLLANSTDNKLVFFSYFSSNIGVTVHANCPLWKQFARNVSVDFLEKIFKKNISKWCLLKFLPSVCVYVLCSSQNLQAALYKHMPFIWAQLFKAKDVVS